MNNITVKDLLGVAREKNSKHYEMPPILTIKDKTVETSKTTISDMLSIVRKNRSDNNIKELNPFYEHDVYESAKREANGHIDMLSNMSNSGESVLDDASYTELEKYFDVNVVYDSDGRALSGNEVLQKYGVTSKSSGVVSENVDTDGLAGIIIDQVNNQKKSPREEVYDGLSPYLTETENARLFSDEAKEMFNAPEGVYQSDYKDRYDYSVNKADNYIGKYDLIIDSIEKNRQLLGDEWADGAIKNANEILDFYKQVKIDAQNYYDYWNQFESEEQYYDYTYAKKYSQSTYGELTSQKNHLYKKCVWKVLIPIVSREKLLG